MGETWNKRERELKKRNAKKKKEERKQERRENTDKGKSLNDMLAYVDEYGNLSATPPEKKSKPLNNDIPPVVANSRDLRNEDPARTGIITFFDSNKGYGFIKDAVTKESIFVHVNAALVELKENLKVTFEVQKGPKGWVAVNVKGA
ncbi:DNA-binding protein [Niabella ginsenosidivorans]|uniref:DNA-binding protein n=1 Tax=Niabella ginsenosidivorans TaxID=1176587 RepID=A0A1A9HY62_9BACT|nr:cold shock domain-containing protein [Niabella ginsenosidivorans]ANH80327.1 DNA-binding protein [Niabella ginsenosidivorans]